MISIKNLTKTFGPVKAVNDLTIDIYPGINGLIGENGAGKSTLLRLISDVYQQDNGEITVDELSNKDISVKNNIFYLSDNPYAPHSMNVEQVYDLYATLFDLDRNNFEGIMKKLKLPFDRKVSTFSKGMRRQFFIAIALSAKAEYVLLDEAFDGLDPLVLDVIKQEIIKEADHKTYIISSHNISSLERLCDNFILLSKGRCKKNSDMEHLGENFVKYQILTKEEIKEEDLQAVAIRTLTFKKLGSIYNIVTYGAIDEDKLKEKYHVILCERIPIDPDELIALEMLNARKDNN